MENNIIPISRGHEIRQEREAEITRIEESFKIAVEMFLGNGGTEREIKDWYFYVSRMIPFLLREPEEMNEARMQIVADYIHFSDGGEKFARDRGDNVRAHLYETGKRCLEEALEFYWKRNDGKLQLPVASN